MNVPRSIGTALIVTAVWTSALPSQPRAAGPSFDCGTAHSEIEKAICADDKLATADRELAALYRKLQHEWPATASRELRATQRGWGKSLGGCAHNPIGGEQPREAMLECIGGLYRQRLDDLTGYVPQKVGGLTLLHRFRLRTGHKPDVEESDDYPWLVGEPREKAAAFDRWITTRLRLGTGLFAGAGIKLERDLEGTNQYQRSFTIGLFDARLISLRFSEHHEATVGHGWINDYALNWDLARDRPLDVDSIFRSDIDWKPKFRQLAIEFLREDDKDKAETAGIYVDSADWLFTKEGATLLLGPGERSLAGFSAEATIPYAQLAPLLRPDAPLPVHAK